PVIFYILFLNDSLTTFIYTLSLHDALPIFYNRCEFKNRLTEDSKMSKEQYNMNNDEKIYKWVEPYVTRQELIQTLVKGLDRALRSEGTRLNSSHVAISYAVFCLKKKKKKRK